MKYIKVRWDHSHPDEPVWLYSEIDEERWEIRKVEVFADGRRGYASRTDSEGGTRLGEAPVPPLVEISRDPQFQPAEITKEEFEEVWAQRKRAEGSRTHPMKQPVFESARGFVLFSYDHGHGLLLLRSVKTSQHSKRIDVLFQDVRAMELRAWFEGVRIEEADASLLQGQSSKPDKLMEKGNKVYTIHGVDWSGFVVGGIVSVNEDDGEFGDPSELLQ